MMAGNPAVIQSMVKDHEDHVKKVFRHIDDIAKKFEVCSIAGVGLLQRFYVVIFCVVNLFYSVCQI